MGSTVFRKSKMDCCCCYIVYLVTVIQALLLSDWLFWNWCILIGGKGGLGDGNDMIVVELQIIFCGCHGDMRSLSGCWHRLSAPTVDGHWARHKATDGWHMSDDWSCYTGIIDTFCLVDIFYGMLLFFTLYTFEALFNICMAEWVV